MRTIAVVVVLALNAGAWGQAQPRLHWMRVHGNPAHTSDVGLLGALDGAGRIFAAGTTYTPAAGYDITLLSFDRAGTLLWESGYAGEGGWSHEKPGDLEPDGAGGVYVAGEAIGFAGQFVVLAHYGADGAQAWVREVPVAVQHGVLFVPRLARDGAGNLLVSGHDGGGFLTLKFDAAGALLWSRRHIVEPGVIAVADDVAADGAGNVYVAGSAYQRGHATVSYDAAGGLRWTHLEPGAINSPLGPAMIAVGPDGHPVVGATPESTCGVHHAGVWKLDAADGSALWTRFAPEARCDSIEVSGMAVGPDGSVVVTGMGSVGPSRFDYQTVLYSADGELLWVRSESGAGDGVSLPNDAAFDAAGNVYITGRGSDGPVDYDFLTASYDPHGARRWAVRQDAGTTNEMAEAVMVGADGAVHLVGTFHVKGEANQIAVIRYGQRTATPATPRPR